MIEGKGHEGRDEQVGAPGGAGSRLSELVRRRLDGELDREGELELERMLELDPEAAAELDLMLSAQRLLRDHRPEPPVGLVDRIMAALPPGPEVGARGAGAGLLHRLAGWACRPVRVPAWAVAATLLLVLGLAGWRAVAPGPGEVHGRKVAPGAVARSSPGAEPAARSSSGGAGAREEPREAAPACRPPKVLVRFLLRAPGAREVHLVGDFNHWSVDATPLEDPDGNGIWTVTVPLPPGRYQYKFLVDGEKWEVEPDAQAYQPDGFGGMNSLLII